MDRKRAQFEGVFVGGDFRTTYEMVVLPKIPSEVTNLSDILHVMEQKLSIPNPVSLTQSRVTLRRTYLLEDWTSHSWTQTPPDLDLFTMYGGDLGYINDIRGLPFGAGKDPVKRLLLNTTWPSLLQEMVVETGVHNDLVPLEAPNWSVSVTFEDNPACLLGKRRSFKTFISLFNPRS